MGNGYRVQGLGYRLCSNAAVHVGSIYGVRVLGGRLVVAQAQCSHACNLWAAILTEVHASLDSGHPLPWHLTPFTLAPHSFYPVPHPCPPMHAATAGPVARYPAHKRAPPPPLSSACSHGWPCSPLPCPQACRTLLRAPARCGPATATRGRAGLAPPCQQGKGAVIYTRMGECKRLP